MTNSSPHSADRHFAWEMLGDLSAGRPNLGPQTSLLATRLMYFSLRAQIAALLPEAQATAMIRAAGRLAGRELCRHLLDTSLEVGQFLSQCQRVFREQGMGLIRVEATTPDLNRLEISVAEDMECSGIPVAEGPVCVYDEGLLLGIIEQYTGGSYQAVETECWALGDRVCRYIITQTGDERAASDL